MKSRVILVVLLAAAAWVAVSLPAGSAPQPVIGTVDYEKVLTDYKAYQQASEQYKAFRTERQAKLDEAANTRLLDEKEQKEYQDLKVVAARTQTQNDRMKELLGLTDLRLKEWDTLRTLPQRDAQQEARFKDLQAQADKTNQAVQVLKTALDKEINDQADKLMKPIDEKISTALAKVAGQEHLIAIVQKESVLYGGKDVTANVLAELNK